MKKLLFFTFILGSIASSYGQHWKFLRHEFTAGIGVSNFLGELGGANQEGSNGITGFKDFEFRMTRPSLYAGYRFYLSPMFAVRANLIYGRLNGDDALTEEIFRRNRNLHFRSPLIQLDARIEFYPFKEYFGHLYRTNGVAGKRVSRISPYLFVGVGGFWFNPKAEYNGNWEALHPLQTEGVDYKKIAATLPFGFGIKYALSNQWSIGLEMVLNYTTTDYIDDVSGTYIDHSTSDVMTQELADPSIGIVEPFTDGTYTYDPTAPGMQRGDDNNNDAYVFTFLTLNYKFLAGKRNLPKF